MMTALSWQGHHRQGAPGIVAAALARVELWVERRRERRSLLALGDHVLKDIGVSRADAERESSKHFWEE